MNNNVIQFSNYPQPAAFDYAAYNRRAEIRLRNSELRAWLVHIIKSVVTLTIAICTIFCVYLAFTML